MNDTVWRARTIVKRDEVKLLDTVKETLSGNIIYHFIVKQRSGDWTDVWFERGLWSCNSLNKSLRKNKFTGVVEEYTWGCVMNNNVDKSKPFCSHTLACKIYLDKLMGIGIEK